MVRGETETSLEEKRIHLTALQNSLEEKFRILRTLDEDILNVCAIDDIKAEIADVETVNFRITESIKWCKRTIKGINSIEIDERPSNTRASAPYIYEERGCSNREDRTISPESTVHENPCTDLVSTVAIEGTSPSSVARSSMVPSSAKPKLTKLMLPKFKGDVTTFQAFWDCFNSAVNNNPDLSAVDKFNYLRALLEGPAARSVQGLTLTASNYSTALEILQDRFGKRQQIISAHMDDLLKLPSCTDNKPQYLRPVYDKICSGARSIRNKC